MLWGFWFLPTRSPNIDVYESFNAKVPRKCDIPVEKPARSRTTSSKIILLTRCRSPIHPIQTRPTVLLIPTNNMVNKFTYYWWCPKLNKNTMYVILYLFSWNRLFCDHPRLRIEDKVSKKQWMEHTLDYL